MKNSILGRYPHLLLVIVAVGLLAMAGCANQAGSGDSDTVKFSQETPGTPQPGQRLFDSPDHAAAALKLAFETKDRAQLKALFGDEGKQLIFTGDRIQENNDMEFYAERMGEMARVDHPDDNTAIIHIGRENYPYPIPIVKTGDQWFFDTAAGKQELLNRQIGDAELNAIAICRAYVLAQKEYARQPRAGGVVQYAQHIMSTPDQKDGLFWEAGPGEALSPLGPEVAQARAQGYDQEPPIRGKPRPYHGYFFHVLKAQGDAAPGGRMDYDVDGKMTKGFALIASPDRFGASGIMTFIVNQDGKVYQKNLGKDTKEIVKTITEYNPDNTWTLVED